MEVRLLKDAANGSEPFDQEDFPWSSERQVSEDEELQRYYSAGSLRSQS